MVRVSAKTDDSGMLPSVGQTIRDHRKPLGISQEALAGLSGIDRGHMGVIERGERNITLLNLKRIADALGCKPSDLLQAAGF